MSCQNLIILKKVFYVESGSAKTHLWLGLITWNAQMSPSFKVLELPLNNLPWDLALAEPPAWTDILTSTVLKKEFLLITIDRLMSGLSFLKPLNGSSPSPLVVKANSMSNPEGVQDTEQDRLSPLGECEMKPWRHLRWTLTPRTPRQLLMYLLGLSVAYIEACWLHRSSPHYFHSWLV